MSEIRHDPLSGHCVIIARDRANRPHAFVTDSPPLDDGDCPFCVGQEWQTPDPIAIYMPDPITVEQPWRVRVVPNKYPAVLSCRSPDQVRPAKESAAASQAVDRGARPGGLPCLISEPAVGAHEVIIESARHVISITELDQATAAMLFLVYRDRLRALRTETQVRYVMAFKNVGDAAGASLAHSHSQVLATPFVPARVALELSHSERYFAIHQRCILCDVMDNERQATHRIVAETSQFIAWCPYASRCPFEICIAPRKHAHQYEEASDSELAEVALLVRELVGRLEAAYPHAAYNYLIHTSPCDAAGSGHFHWHIELLPRLIKFAGFEWGSGCHINPIPPEMAAEKLRCTATCRQTPTAPEKP